jgi:hypothetical protein
MVGHRALGLKLRDQKSGSDTIFIDAGLYADRWSENRI